VLRDAVQTERRTSSGTSESVDQRRECPSARAISCAIQRRVEAVCSGQRALPSPRWKKDVVGMEGKWIGKDPLKVTVIRYDEDLGVG
jgi:hypothetical protein